MKTRYLGLIHTRDEHLARRLLAYVDGSLMTTVVEDSTEIERHIDQGSPILLLLDTRQPDSSRLLEAGRHARGGVVTIAFGVPHALPLKAAMNNGAFATEALMVEREPFQARLERAVEHLHLMVQVHRQTEEQHLALPDPTPPRSRSVRPSMGHFSRALRHFDDMNLLLDNIVDGVAGAMTVSRVGLFARRQSGGSFVWRAGIRCLQGTEQIVYPARDDLPRWLDIHAHLVSRTNLAHVNDADERSLLKQTLNTLGAEMLLPLHARGQLIGWMFLGQRATGVPFEEDALEELLVMAEHCGVMLDNALLYEEVDIQRTLASTVLESLPTGIVTINPEGLVTWINRAACEVFDCTPEPALHHPVDYLNAKLGAQMRACLAGDTTPSVPSWEDRGLGRLLTATVHRLERAGHCDGAVALVQDITLATRNRARQEEVERAAFWTELAAGMSHEVRNPLVAIKTFAQLLPERFDDTEFREEFARIVPREVDRLNKMIEQIDDFAHPPALERELLNVKSLIRKAVERITTAHGNDDRLKIETDIEPELPRVLGDEAALVECLRQVLANASEALAESPQPVVRITARRIGGAAQGIQLTIADNGPGIDESMQDKLFSPFSTTKARGLGLGLPIARRCLIDHDGRINLRSGSMGTAVVMDLPATVPGLEGGP